MLIDILREKNPPLLTDTPIHRDMLRQFRSDLPDFTIIRANNVAEYMYQGTPQEEWDLFTDFPCVAPPFPAMWIEWVVPNWTNSEGHIKKMDFAGSSLAVLIVARELTADVLQAEAGKLSDEEKIWGLIQFAAMQGNDAKMVELNQQLHKMPMETRHHMLVSMPGELRRKFLHVWENSQEVIHRQGFGARWRFGVFQFARIHRKLSFLPCENVFLVHANGHIVPTGRKSEDGSPAPYFAINYLPELLTEAPPQAAFFVPMLTLSFMNCKNVTIVDRRRPLAERTPKAKHWTATYKELEISPIRRILADAQQRPGVGTLQRALHVCRGHFADYTEGRGLFGKFHGRFWVPQHLRGSAEAGTVRKEYLVNTK